MFLLPVKSENRKNKEHSKIDTPYVWKVDYPQSKKEGQIVSYIGLY